MYEVTKYLLSKKCDKMCLSFYNPYWGRRVIILANYNIYNHASLQADKMALCNVIYVVPQQLLVAKINENQGK